MATVLPPPPPPPERLDAATLEGLDDLVAEGPDRALVKSRDFPELLGSDVQPSNITVVLYDQNSVDSFAACYAARRALGDSAVYEGVDRAMGFEDLEVDISGQVVAMVGVCWSIDSLHELIREIDSLFILETHLSVIRELEQFRYPQVVSILDSEMGAAVLAWNFFFQGEPVPPLYRALEDAELGRSALRSSVAFADGFEAAFQLERPSGELKHNDPAFEAIDDLLVDESGRASIEKAVEVGRGLSDSIHKQCLDAEFQRSVKTLRAFPAWHCVIAKCESAFRGRVAEHLAAALVAEGGDMASERSFAAVYEERKTHVRVVLRSLPGGPDVSEIAQEYRGSGRPTRGFFSVHKDDWPDLWVLPEPILWDTAALGPKCLALRKGEAVTIAHRGERFKEAPSDQWSWGYRSEDHSAEGWIPTLAHTILVAVKSAQVDGNGIFPVEEGDILIARGQKGKYLFGTNRLGSETSCLKGWFPHTDGLWQPVHPTTAWELCKLGGGGL